MACHCCCVPAELDPDAFDGRAFLAPSAVHRTRAAARLSVLLSGIHAPDCGHSRVCAAVTQPLGAPTQGAIDGERRDIVARGMKRFEIEKNAPSQPDWERLSPRVVSVLGCNPGTFTLNGTNCYIVGTGSRRILIDAGEAPDRRQDYGFNKMLPTLRRCMAEIGCEGFSHILITHMHGDHFGGTEALLKEFPGPTKVGMIPLSDTSLSLFTVRMLKEQGLTDVIESLFDPFDPVTGKFDVARLWSVKVPEFPDTETFPWDFAGRTKHEIFRDYWYMKNHARWYERWGKGEIPGAEIADGDVISTEGATLRVMHTPGHAENHASFLLEEENCIFSGDHVLGYGTTVLNDLRDYMSSLQRMLDLKPVRLYPGHGPHIADGTGLLSRYIAHRQEREDQVLEFLTQADEPFRLADITDALYVDTPEARKGMARDNISRILLKLYREGRATCQDEHGSSVSVPQSGYVRHLDRNLHWALVR